VFPTPLEMQKNVSAHGRRMVTIVDPHMKRDNNYPIHSEATALGHYIKVLWGSVLRQYYLPQRTM
jgi:alpha 1,3-glucosidase